MTASPSCLIWPWSVEIGCFNLIFSQESLCVFSAAKSTSLTRAVGLWAPIPSRLEPVQMNNPSTRRTTTSTIFSVWLKKKPCRDSLSSFNFAISLAPELDPIPCQSNLTSAYIVGLSQDTQPSSRPLIQSHGDFGRCVGFISSYWL